MRSRPPMVRLVHAHPLGTLHVRLQVEHAALWRAALHPDAALQVGRRLQGAVEDAHEGGRRHPPELDVLRHVCRHLPV